MEIKFSKIALPKNGAIVIGVAEGAKLPAKAQEYDKLTGGALSRAVSVRDFKGKKGESVTLLAPAGMTADAVILTGLGKTKELDLVKLQALGGKIYAKLNCLKMKKMAIIVDALEEKMFASEEVAANIAFGVKLRSYRFDKYRTKEKEEDKPTVKSVTLMLDNATEAEAQFEKLEKIADGIFLARDVVSEPPNVIYPEAYAKRCKELEKLGVEVEILGVKEMEKLGMGSLLGVGQGSARESKLVVMQWHGGGKEHPLAFVGKGVTFDSGGLSLKPANGMEDMKYDMAGSAVVVGLMKALAGRKAKVNVVGIIGLVENMPDGNAQRPSDVVKSMSGQTIEVLNTDAEGRLVLADALWYCQHRFKPKFMVNLATLTGAIIVSLGSLYAGLFSNNDELSKKLTDAGNKVDEKLWRFPMSDEYDKQIDSDIADMQNIGTEKGAGSITAAQFLKRFVNDVPWAHLDIAGVAWAKKDSGLCPKGATGFGIRLLNQLVEEYYE